MTDREEFVALIERWGLIPDDLPEMSQSISFTADGSNRQTSERKLEGYDGFVARFTFDENGKFMSLGVYE